MPAVFPANFATVFYAVHFTILSIRVSPIGKPLNLVPELLFHTRFAGPERPLTDAESQ